MSMVSFFILDFMQGSNELHIQGYISESPTEILFKPLGWWHGTLLGRIEAKEGKLCESERMVPN
jgi:hypothetical protein